MEQFKVPMHLIQNQPMDMVSRHNTLRVKDINIPDITEEDKAIGDDLDTYSTDAVRQYLELLPDDFA